MTSLQPAMRGSAEDHGLPGVNTVIVCTPDGAGRLMGKSVSIAEWPRIVEEGLMMPDFHLATDLTNSIQLGLRVTGAHTGFPNGILRPDLNTLRLIPWAPGFALVICDVLSRDGETVGEAPRHVLQHQLARLSERGLSALVATELEFYIFRESFGRAEESGYRELHPAHHQQGDHDVLVAEGFEGYLSPLRNEMEQLGFPVISTLAEGGVGQLEVNFGHGHPLHVADGHVLFKHTAKSLAARQQRAVTFMAKWADGEPGSSGHVHLSLQSVATGEHLLASASTPGLLSPEGSAFLAGVIRHAREFALLHAPFTNSYRRISAGNWVPQVPTWAVDDRRVMVRLLGAGSSGRLEFRFPGADANPYLSLAALIAAGIEGMDASEELPPSGVECALEPMPLDLRGAVEAFSRSEVAERAMGEQVHRHYAERGWHELCETGALVADWERARGFERA